MAGQEQSERGFFTSNKLVVLILVALVAPQSAHSGLANRRMRNHSPQLENLSDNPRLSKAADELVSCVNEGYAPRNMSWERALNDIMPSLKIVHGWQSSASEPGPHPVTLVTQLTVDRLNQLAHQCASWGGGSRLSAVAYLAIPASTEAEDLPQTSSSNSQASGTPSPSQEPTTLARFVIVTVNQNANGGRSYAGRRGLTETSDRDMLGNIWAGGASAARMVDEAITTVSSFHAKMEAERGRHHGEGGCAMDIMLVVEEVASQAQAQMHYPVNGLRNLARLQARTPLIAMMDVDMLASSQLVDWVAAPENIPGMVQACENGVALVLPAFETYGRTTQDAAAIADKLIYSDKSTLEQAVAMKEADQFDGKIFKPGHGPTNFRKWFVTEEPYEIAYAQKFEPWLIIHRQLAPWHDARFRGYGWNKVQHIAALNATGFRFVVSPSGFIVHRAHERTRIKEQFIADHIKLNKTLTAISQAKLTHAPPSASHVKVLQSQNTTLYGHMKLLMEQVKQEMDAGRYVPVVGPSTARCATVLPWWAEDNTSGSSQQQGRLVAGLATSLFSHYMELAGNLGGGRRTVAGLRVGNEVRRSS